MMFTRAGVGIPSMAFFLLATIASITGASARTVPEILDTLYSVTNGDSWENNDGWNDDTSYDYCKWPGITCYDVDKYNELYRQIETLDLGENNLQGSLPRDVFHIPFLLNLILRGNPDLSVGFKDMSEATMLNKLVLTNTMIESFDHLHGPELRELHLTDCSLNMPFPIEITGLKKLNALYANFNYFNGYLPEKIGNLENLVELFLLGNQLEGHIPDSIANLVNLEILALTENEFQGSVPSDALNNLSKLRILSLGANRLENEIPSLDGLFNIRELYLNDNLFSGEVPIDFLLNAPKDETITVDLKNNKLTGIFGAKRLKEFYKMHLDITDNEFTGIDNDLCAKDRWNSGAVGDYGCDAFLCAVGSWAPKGRSTDSHLCTKGCASATFMGSNNCDGDKKRALMELYNAMNGDYWIENNWNEIGDECKWTGISCTEDADRNIRTIDLSGMKMIGTVPSSIFEIDGLEYLDLSKNFIKFKFDGINKATNLKHLDISSTGLDSLDDLEQLRETSIENFYLSSNNVKSEIPHSMYKLTNLKILKIAHNKFYGGISSKIKQLVNLEQLNVYGNRLSGELSDEFAAWSDTLKVIILSENDFVGSIPDAFSNMPLLKTLSIHQKTNALGGLTGAVPDFKLSPKLQYINLAGNSLSGDLPSTFMENSELLGKEIDIDLSNNKITGQIPSTWDMFGYLNLDLSNNRINHIHSSLCSMKGWQVGNLGQIDGCDAILCEDGYFNAKGRATPNNLCVPCPSAQYFGTTRCDELGSNEVWWILGRFHASTNGEDWTGGEGWLQSADPCDGTWSGIKCDNDKINILEIDLSDCGLTGTPDDMIFNLPRLQSLILSYNDIDFSFGGIGAAQDLRVLKLSETQVSSLDGVGQAITLNALHLTGIYLEGQIPDELFNLVNLRGLYMNYNRFTGRLSSKIGKLVNLQRLYLMNNDLTGQLPASIGDLKEMQILTLSENYFVGTIPDSINNMQNLQVLAISGEGSTFDQSGARRLSRSSRNLQLAPGLTGTLPTFDGLKKLEEIYLGSNSLNGKIPYNFLSGIEDKTKPIVVELEGNYLAGVVPASLTQFDKLELILNDNRFSGIAPGLCSMGNWLDGAVGAFDCDGLLCPKNTFSQTGRRTENQTCLPCPDDTVAPYMGSSKCVSAEEQAIENEREVLKAMYDSLDGIGWHSQSNWYDDAVSFCDWQGITCTSDGKSVQSIHIGANGLKGTLPDVIFDLPNLFELNLSGNEVVVNFDYIGSATKLELLNIDETGVSSLSGIESAPALKLLHASKNMFTSFPQEIASLTNLQVLYLSHNNFDATIPDLSGLTQLAFFACKRCGLHGALPSWIGNFNSLQYLSLSGNKLSGGIPSALAQVSTLTHLDLSDQAPRGGGLTGNVPSFSTLQSLSELYLHKNKLSGDIPDDFMAITTADYVTVDLRRNDISGTVPRTLVGRFVDFTLLLAGNKIEEIPSDICDSLPETWNQGDLKAHGCDGLLCGQGYYGPVGRVTDGYSCKVCQDTGDGSALFFGSTKCGVNAVVQALEAFYNALSGPDWINNEGWSDNDAYCTWYGIECDADDKIIGIDLAANNLSGEVPSETYEIASLTYLVLKENTISVEFSGIEKMSSLTILNLSYTGLSSIAGIGAASSLKELHLTGNELTSIPDDIFSLPNLERLLMNFNKVAGKLSSKIGQLINLKELFLFKNKLSGALPSEIVNLKNIQILALGENDLSGEIPDGISDLQQLEVLALQHASANGAEIGAPLGTQSGRGFSGSIPAFDNNPKLREIYLSFNSLTGGIPNSFLRAVDTKTDEIIVDLVANKISEALPQNLAQFSKLSIYLAGNQIPKIDESLCENMGWMNGEVDNGGCDAILCPIGFFNEFGRQTNDGTACKPCPFTFTAPYLGSTSCTPDSTEYNEREILTKFYYATSGSKWVDADNWLEDNVSICEWHGVHCEAQESQGGTKMVTEIHLPSNKLAGTVPPQIFNLMFLEMFNVRDNKVDVELYAMRESPALLELYLDYTNFSSLKGIGRATNLKTLHMQENNLRGEKIPDELFSLDGLKHLYISDANISGPLSSKLSNLSELKELYCHGNDLTGEIPDTIGELVNLEVLVLSENMFVGPLPESISNLSKLESLFIDSFSRRSAGLSGPLPTFAGMPRLRQLYLNENSFTGPIPEAFLSDEDVLSNDKVSPDAVAALARRKQQVNVGLKGNRIEGSIPQSLTNFQRLNIDLSDNLITSIDDEICEMDSWMGKDVGTYGCEAVLCPAGYFNRYGRQTNPLTPCEQCEGSEQSKFLGATKCMSEIKQREREILELFYNACGGAKWRNKDGWLDDNIDICNWHGINCSNGGSVDTIDVGSNNVIGTPPRDLFELENLTYLWLYSNPIKFSFEGIGRAKRLESLLLDSTGLTSMNGIGQAYQLVDLDLRFNSIKGSIPDELANLVNLETISISDNDLTGELPSLSRMHRLKSLRAANNDLTGILPTFEANHRLKTVDLSDNRISGSISSSFLESVGTSETIYIDLSKNRIEGKVPGELARFEKMTIYLKDNYLLQIERDVCDNDAWNDGDVGQYSCNAILCPPGTFSPGNGRQSLGSYECMSCSDPCNVSSLLILTSSYPSSIFIWGQIQLCPEDFKIR
mmetsp:Transcript_16074/g.24004  ORF Transcript_16074/g.24004 Transcript_16074/m.24004 type:complete len:2620 (-) Transcript_16074:183-8042(-)